MMPPSPVISSSPRCQNPNECCIYSNCHGLISIVNKTVRDRGGVGGGGGMHLHTYTDKVDAAKPVRQTVVVNPHVDLRQSWMAALGGGETDVFFMVDMLERDTDKPPGTIDARKVWISAFDGPNDPLREKKKRAFQK